jgi:hypothetical protein
LCFPPIERDGLSDLKIRFDCAMASLTNIIRRKQQI